VLKINNKLRFFIALIMGVICLIVFYWRFQSMEKQYQEKQFVGKTVKVLVAAEDIQKTSVLQKEMFLEKTIPEDFVKPGAVKSFNDIKDLLAAVAVKKNTQMLNTMTTQKFETGTCLSDHLTGDSKALTIPVDSSSSLNGMIRPTDTVTLMQLKDGTPVPIMSSVHILAVGKVPENYNFSTVTLQVNLEQAKEIIMAVRTNSLKIVLNPRQSALPLGRGR
jgi:Flp pilus assembly protein CpaB